MMHMDHCYWQLLMRPENKEKTEFVTPFNRMPFGLRNAPATFQRLIDRFRNSLPGVRILAYLDDIIVISNTFEGHLQNLESVFIRLNNYKLRAHRKKCQFVCAHIKYLGHILTADGIKMDPCKIDAIINRPPPRNVKQVMSFMQTCSWYRRFIPHFAEIIKPLSELTRKTVIWKWTDTEEDSFTKLKEMLTTAPVLAQANENLPFHRSSFGPVGERDGTPYRIR